VLKGLVTKQVKDDTIILIPCWEEKNWEGI